MSIPQIITPIVLTPGSPVPVYTGTVTDAVAFVISKGLATIVLSSLPSSGYEIGKQITLWGFSVASYFNGTTVTITANNPAEDSFSFSTDHIDVALALDTGHTAPAPERKFRGIRIESDKGNGTYAIYVGDGTVSATRYTSQLKYNTQYQYIWFGGPEITSMNVISDRIFLDCDFTSPPQNIIAQVSLFY